MNLINKEVYQNLPEVLKQPISHFDFRERDIVFISLLGSLSAIMPNVFGEYDSDIVYPNLYFFIVAPPASGKGRVKFAKIIIDKIFENKVEQYKAAYQEYSIKFKEFEKGKNKEGNQEINEPMKPNFKPLLVPGNTTASKFEDFLDEQGNESVIIFETEADSMTNIFKSDYGDYSSDLRCAFSHETISKSRKGGNEYRYIKCPKISLVLVGTPDQVQKLIKSQSNGLFSRFTYYYFEEISDWKNVKPSSDKNLPRMSFEELADLTLNLFNRLSSRNIQIKFNLTDNQWDLLDDTFRSVHDDSSIDTLILSNVKRLGLNTFRISLILSIMRNIEKFSIQSTGYNLAEFESLICEDIDFDNAMKIAFSLLPNTEEILNLYTHRADFISSTERAFMDKFGKNEFSTGEALKFAIESKIGKRTYHNYREKWLKKGWLEFIKNGYYKFK